MKQHKWVKEIKAWADGAEIEYHQKNTDEPWSPFDGRWTNSDTWEYRIKPQPKKPQYLYLYEKSGAPIYLFSKIDEPEINMLYLGKIKLEENDD
jgi:hypothetical protein